MYGKEKKHAVLVFLLMVIAVTLTPLHTVAEQGVACPELDPSHEITVNDRVYEFHGPYLANHLNTGEYPTDIRTPAEWEQLDEVLLRWGSPGSDYYNMQIVREVADVATAQIVTTGGTGGIYEYLEGHGVNMDNVSFASVSTNTGWIRDYGPISIINQTTGEMYFANMRYRRYSSRPADDAFPQNYAPIKGVNSYDTRDGDLWYSNDGGNFIVDGAGLFYGTEAIYNYGNNSDMTPAEVEQYSMEYFNLRRFSTVTRMPGESTGHIDMAIKLLNETTVLVSQLMDVGGGDGDYQALESAAVFFQGLTARNGQPYEVVRIPMERSGSTYYTYSNSLIVNGKVLVPTYGRTYDAQALSIYEDAMPGYDIIGIDSSGVITQGGAIHCTTMQIAKDNRPPTIDIVDINICSEGITVSVDIVTSPGMSFAHLYYNSSEDDDLVRVSMEATEGSSYQAVLPHLPNGAELRYFVQVEDNYRALNYSGDVWNMHTYEIQLEGEPPEISITSPVGGDVWYAGTNENISWYTIEAEDPIERIDLWYSTDNGDSWNTIATRLADTGNYTWSLPNEHSTHCLIRAQVLDSMGRYSLNISHGTFTIVGVPPVPPSNLRVEHYGFDDVIDNGVFLYDFEPWILTRVVDQGESSWVDENYSEGGSIRVNATQAGNGISTEESYWEQEITPISSNVTVGAAFRRLITLESGCIVHQAKVEVLLHDTEIGWQTLLINDDTSQSDTGWNEFEPVVYEPTGEVDAVRVEMHVVAEGNTEWVLWPRTAEGYLWVDNVSVMVEGTQDNLITWDASPDHDVIRYNIYRSEHYMGPWNDSALIQSMDVDGSESYEYVDIKKGMADDIYWWYVVRAVGMNGLEEQNSNAVQEPGGVTPGDPPEINLTAPNDGEVWAAETWENITWTTNETQDPIDKVDLWYSTDAGDTWISIASGIPDTGSHNWSIPNVHSTRCLVRLRVWDIMGRWAEDVSNETFTIEAEPPAPPSDLVVEHYGFGSHVIFQDDIEGGDIGYITGTSRSPSSEWGIRSHGSSVGEHSWDFGDGLYYKTNDYGYLSWLISPEIEIPTRAENVELSFDHWRNFGAGETYLDGGNLKISTNGAEGPFTLITPNEGYDGVINNNYGNPLGGQQAWGGTADWETVTFDLTTYASQSVHIRWDAGIEAYDEDMEAGWRIDNITVIAEGIETLDDEHNLLTWYASPDDPGTVIHYNIYRSESFYGPWNESTLINSIPANGSTEYSYIDEDKGALDEIYWWYIVRAVNEHGLECEGAGPVQEPAPFRLNISIEGEGTTEPTEGTHYYYSGSEVTLNATASYGWRFSHWSGDVNSTDDQILVTMESNKMVTAHFVRDDFSLTISVEGNGTTDPSAGVHYYEYEDEVTLIATPNNGWLFSHWSGDVDSTEEQVNVTMDENKTVTAHFIRDTFSLTINVEGEGTTVPEAGVHYYEFEDNVTVNATPSYGWRFSHWSGDVDSTEELIYVVMDENKTVTAHFVRDVFSLTIIIEGEGTIYPVEGVHDYEFEYEVTLNATPSYGWRFSHWSGDVDSTEEMIYVVMDENKTVTAHFVRDVFSLNISIEGNGTTDPSAGIHYYEYEDEVTLNATPSYGWRFSHWSGDVDSTEEMIYVVMDENKTINAHFVRDTFSLTISVEGEGTALPATGIHYYEFEENVTVNATPSYGWRFSHWSGDVDSTEEMIYVVMDENKTVTAHFVRDVFSLNISIEGNGTTDPSAGIHYYEYEDEVTLNATPSYGWRFSHWSGDVDSTEEMIYVLMDENKTINAHFVRDTFSLTINLEGEGTALPEAGVHYYEFEENVTVNATPSYGWRFSHWSGDVDSTEEMIYVVMDENKTINAHFVQIPTMELSLHAEGEAGGWNFVSFYIELNNTDLVTILEHSDFGISGNYDRVMYYQASNDEWLTYVPGRPDHFNNLDRWDNTMGIWIRMIVSDVLTIQGSEPAVTDVTLYPGWNMVGIPSESAGNHGLPTEVTRIGFFNASEEYNIDYTHDVDAFVFDPGRGYWVYNSGNENVRWTIHF